MSVLHLISIHGVTNKALPTGIDYSLDLHKNIVEELTNRHHIIPKNATPAQVEAIISFDHADYSTVGVAARQKVYEAYLTKAAQVENLLDKTLDALLYRKLREFVIGNGGSVLIYESDYGKTKIRDMVSDLVTVAIPRHRSISLVGHSLGSVVSFDVAYWYPFHDPYWQRYNFFLSNLFTIGSPLALFTLDLQAEATAKTRYNNPPDMQLVAKGGAWYNFFDAQDLIAYPLENLYPGKVSDYLVQTGTSPLAAHAGYWKNKEVASRIAGKLAQDYAALTAASK